MLVSRRSPLALVRRLGRLFGAAGRLEAELDAEIQQHIELRRRALIESGVDPREAAYEARRQFGNPTWIREESSAMWRLRPVETLMQDLRYGALMLWRSPTFTIVAVLSLAVGIGAAAAVFNLADVTLFRTLPVRDPHALVVLRWTSGPVMPMRSLTGNFDRNEEGNTSTSFALNTFNEMARSGTAHADVFGFADLYAANFAIGGRTERGTAQVVSGNYFEALGVRVAAGRGLVPSDDREGAAPVAVISDAAWERSFQRSPGAIGQPLMVNGLPFTIVGVTPRNFQGTLQVGDSPDATVPLAWYSALTRSTSAQDPEYWWVLMMGRLKPGVTRAQAQPALDLLLRQSVAAGKPSLAAKDLPHLTLLPGARGQHENRNGMREPLATMAVVVAIVLLVACSNLANLLLARGRARARELSVRIAIGAARGRIVRQLLTEGILLAALGSALGLAVSRWITATLMPAVGSPALATLVDAQPGWRIMAFAIGLASLCTVLFALVPAVRATDLQVARGLQENSRSTLRGRRAALSGGLVVVQVALSMLLVSGAGLLEHSVRNLQRVDPGFDAANLLVFTIDPAINGYDEARTQRLLDATAERLAAIPGVERVAFSNHMLISGAASSSTAALPGTPWPQPRDPEARRFHAERRVFRLTVDEGFLETMRIPIMRGRNLTRADNEKAGQVAVINRTLARQLFGTEDAVGRRFTMSDRPGDPGIDVVGVAADAKYNRLRGSALPIAYLPFRQFGLRSASFALRTSGDPLLAAESVREAIRGIDPALAIGNMRTQQEQIERSIARERLFARLATTLGVVAVLLAGIGLYALLGYSVTRRTPEIGIRLALGAGQRSVRLMVLRQSLVLVAAGLVIGLPAAYWGTRIVESMLFELSATDPATFALSMALLLVTAIVAAYIPARRASRVDPMVALRSE